jgi:cytosine/uracil/thiamine/allantoin permease
MKTDRILKEFISFVVFGVIMIPILWMAAEQVNEPWAYTMRGIALMLWPMQWAFWLGQNYVRFLMPNAGSEPPPPPAGLYPKT